MKYIAPKISRSHRTRIFNSRITFIALAAFALLTLAATSALMDPPLTGAIFTTDSTCSGVDLNIYASKDDVYLTGGPDHPSGSGLPDGSYYVQVTQPDGTVLGKSLSPVVTVSGGIFPCSQLSSLVLTASSVFTLPGYDDTLNPGGEYKVWVSKVSTFDENSSKTDNFKVKCHDCGGVPPQGLLKVIKFYDANTNGVLDALPTPETQLAGWETKIQDTITLFRFTPVNAVVDPDTYTVSECDGGAPWQNTTPTVVTGVVVTDGGTTEVRFGNVCFAPAGGLTLGFWSNKNGAALIGSDDLLLLRNLNLRNANGSTFDPTTYTQFRTWLLGATATNMSYMLSAQLAAMELNVYNGQVNGTLYIYAPGTASANTAGFATINLVMAEANTELGLHGQVLSGSPSRDYQQALKDALDHANNNLNIVSPTPCAVPVTFTCP